MIILHMIKASFQHLWVDLNSLIIQIFIFIIQSFKFKLHKLKKLILRVVLN